MWRSIFIFFLFSKKQIIYFSDSSPMMIPCPPSGPDSIFLITYNSAIIEGLVIRRSPHKICFVTPLEESIKRSLWHAMQRQIQNWWAPNLGSSFQAQHHQQQLLKKSRIIILPSSLSFAARLQSWVSSPLTSSDTTTTSNTGTREVEECTCNCISSLHFRGIHRHWVLCNVQLEPET